MNKLAQGDGERLFRGQPAEQPLSVPLRQRLDSILIVPFWVEGEALLRTAFL